MMLHSRFAALVLAGAAAMAAGGGRAAWGEVKVSENAQAGAFAVVSGKQAAAIFYDGGDAKVVEIVAGLLAGDVERVTGVKPVVRRSDEKPFEPAKQTLFMGTLGHAPAIDAIIKEKKIDVSGIEGKWESYLVVTVEKPMAGVDSGLMIIGSDRRGTAFGALDLSEKMGVSPWNWWADVPALRHENVFVTAGGGAHVQGPPSVKYRGLFINDEDWGLQPWAAKTYEPTSAGGVGDIGPKSYAKIFELLLRLKANYCWPAMHPSTKAFNIYPDNKKVADDYAIVMGSSHCEQLLRNGVSEWKDAQGRVGQAGAASYNWVTNSAGLIEYWKERLRENGKYENVYTLGLRGVHDSDMSGGGTTQEKAKRLNEIYGVQRNLLKEFVNPDVTKVPQIIVPYKEALIYYQNGAIPADDVTVVWVDDNHGYIRQLSTPAEQKRSGGSGVYYHISYWGRPHDYLWLCTTPPSLVWEELSKAYDYGARDVWVINVGDIKPGEIGLTMAMAVAYDAKRFTVDNVGDFAKEFATQNFGPAHAQEIADVLNEHYRLNYQRKPEHMGFNTSQNPGGPLQPTEFSDAEIAERLAAFDALVKKTDALVAVLPAEARDGFFELVAYPVRGSALQNQKMLGVDVARRSSSRGDAAGANAALDKAKKAYDQIQAETATYNNVIAGGKWKNIMSAAPRNLDVFKAPVLNAAAPGAAATPAGVAAGNGAYVSIAAEHFTRKVDRGGGSWKVIPRLGRVGDSIGVYPTTTPSVPEVKNLSAAAPAVEYDFTATTANAAAKITLEAIPTHRINSERGLRYAVAIDGETPQVVDLETPEFSAPWSVNVLRGAAFGVTTHNIAAGKHTLHVYMVDPGVIVDHITIDLGGLPKGYLPPAETK